MVRAETSEITVPFVNKTKMELNMNVLDHHGPSSFSIPLMDSIFEPANFLPKFRMRQKRSYSEESEEYSEELSHPTYKVVPLGGNNARETMYAVPLNMRVQDLRSRIRQDRVCCE